MHTLELLNEQSVSALLGLTPRALQNLRWRGGGPRYVKLGRRVLYDRADIEAWIQQNKRSHTADQAPATTSSAR